MTDRKIILQNSVRLQKGLLACGIVSSLLYVLTDIVASTASDNYHYTSQTVSELFAVNAPTRGFVTISFVWYALLIYAFGAGVWISARERGSLKFAAVMIIGKELSGMIGTLFFPIHLRGVEGDYSDVMHGIVTAAGVLLFMLPAMIAGSVAFKGKFRIYSIFTMVAFIVFGMLTAVMQPRLTADQPTPLMGIWERINIYGYLLWIAIFAIKLRPSEITRQNNNTR